MLRKDHARKKFYYHLTRNVCWCLILIVCALVVGMIGYHYFENLAWVDAFLNASMIMSGMGPVSSLSTTSAKIFAGCYALFSGLIFIALITLILTPNAHYIFQKVHLDDA